jgi:hypothetical protein
MKKDYTDILKDSGSLDANIAAILMLIWAAPILLAYLILKFCLINPLKSLFGDKK